MKIQVDYIMGGMKGEKLKSWILAGSPSDKFNLCVVGATTLLLLCAGTLHLRPLSEKMITPRTLLRFWSSHIDIPPESECYIYIILVLLDMINNLSPLYM